MKRIALYFGIATALVASCSIQEKDFQTPVQDDDVFFASFEQPAEEGTRVYANEDLLLRWTADDRVSIFNKLTYNQQYKFIGETGDNSGGFNKVDGAEYVTGNPILHTVSVYPYQATTKITEDEVLTVTIPAEQHYAENTFGLGANTMVSVSSDNFLLYKNVGGYLMLKLYGEGVSVSSITLKGNNGEKLAGKATVTMPLNGIPAATMTDDATTEITLTCPTPVQLGATEEDCTEFWFVVPPVTFSKGFTIAVREEVGFIEKSTAKSLAIERNKLSKMSPIEVPKPSPRQTDSLALVAIYNASDGASWAKNQWELDKPINTWPAVTVTENRVTALKLSTANVITKEWTLPEEIGELTELTDLRINGNKLTGDLPESLYSLTKLENLYFQNDNLTGALSSKLGQLTELSQLYVDRNANMTGGIPKEIGNLKKLTRINISQTGIGGDIPAELGQCESLLQFMAFKCNLSGTLPDIWDMPALQTVMMYGNPGLTGELPASLGKLKPIVNGENITAPSLQIYGCNFTGNIPESFAGLHEKTKQVYVQENKMSGVIPPAVAAHPNFASWRWDPQQEGYGLMLEMPVPEAVDLGLSVKWAPFNVGAVTPDESGYHFAWGETQPKSDFSWATYQWCNGAPRTLTKYNSDSSYGAIDNKVFLDLSDDAARANWGDGWRTPTDEEITELRTQCTWTWTTQSGKDGYRVTGTNGNSIFLPLAGRCGTDGSFYTEGGYWSSMLSPYNPPLALALHFDSGNVSRFYCDRFYGLPIRPVFSVVPASVRVENVSLDRSNLELYVGNTAALTATVLPADADNKSVTWSSSNESVATVSSDGAVTALAVGTAVITVTAVDGGKTASCTVTVTKTAVPEAVDMGLSVKWASFNLGATVPEALGELIAWGETQPKSIYDWNSYKWCNGAYDKLTKYCYTYYPNYWWDLDSIPDGKSVLDLEDDAAHDHLGGGWRMPTHDEIKELYDKCTWSWVVENGVSGFRISSNVPGHRGQSIFLPGIYNNRYIPYWSSSLYTNRYAGGGSEYPYSAMCFVQTAYGPDYHHAEFRSTAALVRPVYGARPRIPVTGIVLSGSLFVVDCGGNLQLSATVYPENADNKEFSWVSDNESVVLVDSNGRVTGVRNGEAHVTVLTSDQGKVATCTVVVKTPSAVPEMVDLGLSVKWATHNIGASSPEEYGDYFAWGEISTKSDYSLSTYKWTDPSIGLTKYNDDQNDGILDNKSQLDPDDDVAHVYLGGSWRMPTEDEFQELIDKCTWVLTNRNGVNGYVITSKLLGYTNRSIFLPAAGYYEGTRKRDLDYDVSCCYWALSIWKRHAHQADCFVSNEVTAWFRYYGLSIRPVYAK